MRVVAYFSRAGASVCGSAARKNPSSCAGLSSGSNAVRESPSTDGGKVLPITAIPVTGDAAAERGREASARRDPPVIVAVQVHVSTAVSRLAARRVNGQDSRGIGQERLGRRFFFSSRRRHTRLQGDWSSDVCSSD